MKILTEEDEEPKGKNHFSLPYRQGMKWSESLTSYVYAMIKILSVLYTEYKTQFKTQNYTAVF